MNSTIRKSIPITLLVVVALIAAWVFVKTLRSPTTKPSATTLVQNSEETPLPVTLPANSAVPLPDANEVVAKPPDWPDDIERRIYDVLSEVRDTTVRIEAVHCKWPECQVTLTTEDNLAGRQHLEAAIYKLQRSSSIGAGSMGGKSVELLTPGLLKREIVLFSASMKFSM
jgi:hypothetical protein